MHDEYNKPYENATYCIILSLWHSGKGRTVEIVKGQWTAGFQGERTGLNK